MVGYRASLGIGVVTGMRSMTACAALTWAASQGRTRPLPVPIPSGPGARFLATGAAVAEMAGDKMPFAPDRRIPSSVAVRLAIGALGGAALAGRQASPTTGALVGMLGAIAGTLIGRAARGGTTRSGSAWARALGEDMAAAGLAAAVIGSAEERSVRTAVDAQRDD
ncbi:MAG: hypothetical protein K2Y56_25185 [Methylobacterium sp.]|uniref:hypothetical protein n=1 Tax=Methylobacterium sp. TaxID=409 RepID=UPI0025E75463|nr:hypothetical protein [Methylobacterium sp.]MBX9934766.1 hypothetical protein [Methylobacterium sp.]